MDIKKTMNVAIERIHDPLTKGTGDEIRRTRERGLSVREGKLIFAILVLQNWLLMFYSSADNGGAEAIPRGEKVVRLSARVKDLRGYVVLAGEALVLLKGIASLTGVKSTSPPWSSPLLRLTDISWSLRQTLSFLPSFLPSFFPFFLSSFLHPFLLFTLPFLSLIHLRAFFLITFSHKGFQAYLASFSFQLDERLLVWQHSRQSPRRSGTSGRNTIN